MIEARMVEAFVVKCWTIYLYYFCNCFEHEFALSADSGDSGDIVLFPQTLGYWYNLNTLTGGASMKSDYWWFTMVVTQTNTYSKDKYIIKVCKKLRGECPMM